MSQDQDMQFMNQALNLAERGRYSTHPNPRVGCVVVRDGRVVGEGAHLLAGQPHAERLALAAAGAEAKGATLYVTLEPCCHHGRTPPCTEAILSAGVTRVVVGMVDPNPQVAGQGVDQLRAAGVVVDGPLLAEVAQALNRGFIARMTRGRPWVRLKQASSVDGKVALANGESQWLTGPEARADVQRERAAASAVLVGVGTVLADNPRLAPRVDVPLLRPPIKVVLDGHLRTPADAALFKTPGQTWIIHRQSCAPGARGAALVAAGAKVFPLPDAPDGAPGIDLRALWARLGDNEINEVLVEGGPRLASALLRGGWIDEWLIYLAPLALGQDAQALATIGPFARLTAVPRWRLDAVARLGDDVKLRYLYQEAC